MEKHPDCGGCCACLGTPDPPKPQTGRVILDVPYSSQVVDVDALKYRNDCGPACLEMIGEWDNKDQKITTDEIMKWITKGADKYTGLGDLIRAGMHFYNLSIDYHSHATWEQLVGWVAGEERPVIALVHYGDLYFKAPTRFTGPHFVVVVGYEKALWGTQEVEKLYYHDPLFPSFYGHCIPVLKDTWIATWSGSTKDGNKPRSVLVPHGSLANESQRALALLARNP